MKKILKPLVIFLLYYTIVITLVPKLVDPHFTKYLEYHRLNNWDLKQHAIGDFDNDGLEDLITFSGCAFLSSSENTPSDNQCVSPGISTMYFEDSSKIGEKYIQTNESKLDLEYSAKNQIPHSFLAKNKDGKWEIHSDKIYIINQGESLGLPINKNLSQIIDELLYTISSLYTILLIPITPAVLTFILLKNQKKVIHAKLNKTELAFFSLIFSWYLIVILSAFFPYVFTEIISPLNQAVIFNNLIDLITLISITTFVVNLCKKNGSGLSLISFILLIYPIFIVVFRIQDFIRFG